MEKKRVAAVLTALTLIVSTLASPALATEITAEGTAQAVPMEVTAEPSVFKVVLPTSFPVHVAADGTVTTADYGIIENWSGGPICIDAVKVETANGWSLANWDDDLTALPVGTKQFAMWVEDEFNKVQVSDGRCGLVGFKEIPAEEPLNGKPPQYHNEIRYGLKVAPQNVAVSGETMANVVLTVGWKMAQHYQREFRLLVDPTQYNLWELGVSITSSTGVEVPYEREIWYGRDADGNCVRTWIPAAGRFNVTLTYRGQQATKSVSLTSRITQVNISTFSFSRV